MLDTNNVYWTNVNGGNVVTLPKSAGTGTSPTVLASSQIFPEGIAVSGTAVYWTTFTVNGSLNSAPLDGSGTVSAIASGAYPTALVINSQNAYFTDGQSVFRAPLSGGGATAVTSGQSVTALALDASNIYWVEASGNVVRKMPLGGGAAVTIAANQKAPQGIAVDAAHVYWANYDGTIMRADVDGNCLTTLATAQSSPGAIAVDSVNVYWLNAGTSPKFSDGTVMSAPK